MPEFTNPFIGNVPRQMSHGELVRAIMLDISAELEAVHIYMAQMDATQNEQARKVLLDVAHEELTHAGEFTSLLYRLDPVAGAKAREGFEEVEELLGSKSPYELEALGDGARGAGGGKSEETGDPASARAGFTVGSLKV